jgi:hypothetical protein
MTERVHDEPEPGLDYAQSEVLGHSNSSIELFDNSLHAIAQYTPANCLIKPHENLYSPSYLTAKVTAEPREKGEQPETPVDKTTQDANSRAALQAIPPNA